MKRVSWSWKEVVEIVGVLGADLRAAQVAACNVRRGTCQWSRRRADRGAGNPE